MRAWLRLILCQRGQDVVEYTLLLAFVGLSSAAVLVNVGQAANGVWNTTDSHLKKGNAYGLGHGTGEPDKPDKSHK